MCKIVTIKIVVKTSNEYYENNREKNTNLQA